MAQRSALRSCASSTSISGYEIATHDLTAGLDMSAAASAHVSL
jgi:hypothetical protein